MAIRILDERLVFPPAEEADAEGLVAIGGDLSVDRLVLAYRGGIFPWPMPGWPLPWCSPDPRCVLFPAEVRVPRCVKPLLNRRAFEVTWNRAFREVISACRTQRRAGQSGTWIRRDMLDAYCRLHEAGHAHSLELWQDGKLAGGLYGVRSGCVFSGESAFHRVPNAAKVAIVLLAQSAGAQGIRIIDCQMRTPLLESLGARFISRQEFLRWLRDPPASCRDSPGPTVSDGVR